MRRLLALLLISIALPAFSHPKILHLPDERFYTPATLLEKTQDINTPKVIISSTQARALYPYALASHMAHSYKLERSKPEHHHWNFDRLNHLKLEQLKETDLPESARKYYQKETKRFEHIASGLQARGFIHRTTGTIILAFAGTDFDTSYRSTITISAAAQIAYGYRHQILTEARWLCQHLKNHAPIKNIILTGLSLGGAIAHYAGLACHTPAIAFNSLALPDNLRLDAVRHRSKEARTRENTMEAITHYKNWLILAEVDGEYLNSETTWGNALFQTSHPKDIPIYTIPAADENLASLTRHWSPALIHSIEKSSQYHFPPKTK